jgi:hypothetical protein
MAEPDKDLERRIAEARRRGRGRTARAAHRQRSNTGHARVSRGAPRA